MAIRRGLIAPAVLATLGVANPGFAADESVLIVNPPSKPVPVTGSVTGTVTGTVGLAPGTSVGLTPGTSVMIDSTVGDPVRVRNVNDAIQPAQAAITCISPSLTIGCGPVEIYTVPAGKRLVIEYASMSACMLPGQTATLTVSTRWSCPERPRATTPATCTKSRPATIPRAAMSWRCKPRRRWAISASWIGSSLAAVVRRRCDWR